MFEDFFNELKEYVENNAYIESVLIVGLMQKEQIKKFTFKRSSMIKNKSWETFYHGKGKEKPCQKFAIFAYCSSYSFGDKE